MKVEDFKEVLTEYGVPYNDWGGISYHGLNLGYYTEHLIEESKLSLIAHFVIDGKTVITSNKDDLRNMLGDAVKFAKEWELNDKLANISQDFND